MDELTRSLTSIVAAIIGVAILAVIVSKSANTSGVVQSAASGIGNALAVAQSPVTGASVTPNLSYANSSGDTSGGFDDLTL
jgi:hypothetical protein